VSSLILMVVAEIMDFGYPQNLSPEILKLYITQEGVRSPFSSKQQDTRPPANATLQVTGAVGWRREGLVYKKNEVCSENSFLLFEPTRISPK
jgi:AP-2 complex subunit mu-1